MFRSPSTILNFLMIPLVIGFSACSKVSPSVHALNSLEQEPVHVSDHRIFTQLAPSSTGGFQNSLSLGYKVSLTVVAHEPAPVQTSLTLGYKARLGVPSFTWKRE